MLSLSLSRFRTTSVAIASVYPLSSSAAHPPLYSSLTLPITYQSVDMAKEKSGGRQKRQQAKKDPNKPKRPASAFFIFMEDFRKSYKEAHPDVKGVSEIGRACGEKWREMTDEEKAPYATKAASRKADYDRAMSAFNNGEVAGKSNGASSLAESEGESE